MHDLKSLAAAVLAMGLMGGAVLAQDIEELAVFPGPTFLENLTVADSGDIYVTNYSDRHIEAISPDGTVRTLADLDVHPVSIQTRPGGFAVVAHGTSFVEGDAFVGTGRFLTLDADGAVIADQPLAGVLFANGLLADGGDYLIADSIGARVVRFDPDTGEVSTFFEDPRFAPRMEPAFQPGVNGIKRDGSSLVLSSSATRALYRLPLDASGQPHGALEEIVSDLPGADDFAVLPEGGFIVATHGESVVTVDADGAVAVLSDDPRLRGSTAVAVIGAGERRRVIALGTGGYSEGLGEDAVVAALPVPDR